MKYPIPIDLELVDETKKNLEELTNILKEEKYSEESVINKIKIVNEKLFRLNQVPKSFKIKYNIEFQKWQNEIERNQIPFNEYLDDLNKIVKAKIDDNNIEEYLENIKNFNKKYNNADMKKSIENAFKIDLKKAMILQSQWSFKKFSWQRNKIRFFTNFTFKFRYILLGFIAAFISFIITTVIALILGLAFERVSDFVISLGLFVVSFFTLDQFIKRKSNKMFWKIVRKQSLVLLIQLVVYTKQLAIITSFLKSQYEK